MLDRGEHGKGTAGGRRDGRVAQSLIPPADVRIPYAMETHGVEASLLQSQPTQARFCFPEQQCGVSSVPN